MQPTTSFPSATTTRALSFAEMQDHIQRALNDKITGQIRAVFHRDVTITLFAQQGKLRQVYLRNHRVPNTDWKYSISVYGDGALNIEPLPARALLFKKVILETLSPVSPKIVKTNQIHSIFQTIEQDTNPTLFHIKWQNAEGYVVTAGKSISLRYAVMRSPVGASEGQFALDQFPIWDEPQCQVTTYHGDIKNQAWLEVHLNILFEWYCARVLRYYEQLTGSVMLQSILRRVYILAIDEGWSIETQRKSLSDATLFPSAGIAGRTYKRIISLIEKQIEPIIGSALAQKILEQAYNDIPKGIYKTIAEAFEITENLSS